MPLITIDNKEYEVKAGDNILQACLSLGLDLPYFCWHPEKRVLITIMFTHVFQANKNIPFNLPFQ